MNIKLRLPLRDILVTQPFGVNFVNFYRDMGLPGHPGVDFRAKHRCTVYAANGGEVIWSGTGRDGGIGIEIRHSTGYSTFYYHLDETLVRQGQGVVAGDLIGYCDNTGRYTIGDHLHFELRINGIKVDPDGYFFYTYNGIEIKPKDWNKPRSYHRYYRQSTSDGQFKSIKMFGILIKNKIKPTTEKINALVYGGWDIEAMKNPAMYELYSQLKKDEYINKNLKPFQ